MRTQWLPFSRPSIGEEEIAEVVDALRSDWITAGPKVKRFEKEFASAVGASGSLALSSCTAALHLALLTQGIGPGDAVITTPMTFCSGIHVIEQTGARPILVDVEPDTLNIDPARVDDTIVAANRRSRSSRVKAVLPVHLYGHPCEMAQLIDIAQDHGFSIIEDAAHAIPASYRGIPIGSHRVSRAVPILTCFSFYATKNLTTAEGGMLTGPADAIEGARCGSLHGMSRDSWNRYGEQGSWFYEVVQPGWKYNMTDLQAAMGLHQLRKQFRFHVRRAEIAGRYNKAFSQFDSLQIPSHRSHVDHAWHLYVLRLNLDRLNISRKRFIEELASRKIGSSVHFIPVHLHPYFRDRYGYKPEDFPIAYREYQRIISLPLYPAMSDEDVQDVIESVSEIARKHAHRPSAPGTHSSDQDTNTKSAGLVASSAATKLGIALRRAFDVACSAVGLAVLAPVLATIAVAIKLEDGGPVFYVQSRVGKGLRKFRLVKFRSMVFESHSSHSLTAPGDPRITRVGRWLRRHKLDELPQLINVLKGEMQIVGPRPELEQYVRSFPRQYAELLRERPGITDLASLTFRHEDEMFQPGPLEAQYVMRILPEKLKLSLEYCRARTFPADLGIILRTVFGFKPAAANWRAKELDVSRR